MWMRFLASPHSCACPLTTVGTAREPDLVLADRVRLAGAGTADAQGTGGAVIAGVVRGMCLCSAGRAEGAPRRSSSGQLLLSRRVEAG